jgi:hypothetical protein
LHLHGFGLGFEWSVVGSFQRLTRSRDTCPIPTRITLLIGLAIEHCRHYPGAAAGRIASLIHPSERVRALGWQEVEIILHRTGKLVLQGGRGRPKLALFTENQGDDNARYLE